MLLGHASRVVAVLALIISGNPIFLYVFAFFIGFSALWYQMNPARTALMAESVPNEKRATAYGTLMAISQGTSMVMASVGGYLAIVTGYWWIFAITIVGETIGIAIMALFVKETHNVGRRQQSGGRDQNNREPKTREGADAHLPDDGCDGHRLRCRILTLLRRPNGHLQVHDP